MAQEEQPRFERARPKLTPAAYRSGIAASFSIWGATLFIVFYSRIFEVWVKREDLIGLAQTVAALAAVALAAITIVQETGNRDRYLKLLLAGLTFILLLATLATWISALTMKPVESDPGTRLPLRVLIVAGAYFALSVPGFLTSARNKKRRIVPQHSAYDYSPFAAPFFAFALWSPQLSLAGTSVVLSIGGMVYLIVSTVVLLVCLWNVPSHAESLEGQVLGILERVRTKDQSKGTRQPISLDYLRSTLGSNDDTLRGVLDGLCREDRVVKVNYTSYYILRPEDWSHCQDILLDFEVVALSDSLNDFPWDEIFQELGEKLHIPDSVVKEYLAERIRELVHERFEPKGTSGDKGEFRLYFKKSGRPWSDLSQKGGGWETWREAGRTILESYSCLPSKVTEGNVGHLERYVGWAAVKGLP